MAEKPILFSAPMVRAILAGPKTQTRRVVKLRHPWEVEERDDGRPWPWHPDYVTGGEWDGWVRCPYGKPGDRLWVRETWRYANWTDDGYPFVGYAADGAEQLHENIPSEWGERLENIWAGLSDDANYAIDGAAADRRWRPSIHMPRWACRLVLEITDVRIERLQSISEEDAIAEGAESAFAPEWFSRKYGALCGAQRRYGFVDLWASINGIESWEANPWVWVVSFKRAEASRG